MSISFTVSLPNYNGPLDLLWRLIHLNNIDIFDIPIAKITADFLHHIRNDQTAPVTELIDFYYFACRLIAIKINVLFPDAQDDEHVDPRIELVEELIEFQRIKKLGIELKMSHASDNRLSICNNKRQQIIKFYAYKEKRMSNVDLKYKPNQQLINPARLIKCMSKLASVIATFNAQSHTQLFSLMSMEERVFKYLVNDQCYLDSLITGNNRHAELLAAILVVLVFCLEKKIIVQQATSFAPIVIHKC